MLSFGFFAFFLAKEIIPKCSVSNFEMPYGFTILTVIVDIPHLWIKSEWGTLLILPLKAKSTESLENYFYVKKASLF